MFKCKYCSRSYRWEQSLKRHVNQDHTEESSEEDDGDVTDASETSDDSGVSVVKSRRHNIDDDSDDDDDDDNNESIWIAIVEAIVNQHKSQYEEKLQHIIATDDIELVEEEMRPLYKRELKKFVTEQILRDYKLLQSEYYTKLMRDFRMFVKKRPNNTLLRSVHATLRNNDQVLDDMLDDFDDNIRRYLLNENQENDMESAEGQQ